MNSAAMLLERAASLFGENTALQEEGGSLTYRQYRDRARQVGSGLLRAGCGGRPVVVVMPKGIDALTAFMGALYAGSPYVPVDYAAPLPRLQKILKSVGDGAVVTTPDGAQRLSSLDLCGAEMCLFPDLASCPADGRAVDAALRAVIDTDPVYIMYTSGSTGSPKGVVIPHRGILDYAVWVCDTFSFGRDTVLANQSAFYFDNSTFDIYGSMYCGGKLILTPEALFMFPGKLPEFLAEHEVTAIFWVPTVMINTANSGALESTPLPRLQTVAFCGEVMPNAQLNIWRRALPGRTFANLYGPTEITDVCCYYIADRDFTDSDPLPIGRACENMRVLLITEDGREAEQGQQGEICVLGSGVALGYWNEPELTEKAFTPVPLPGFFGQRMYRTGDLGYMAPDGLLMFLGRRDSQIKLRGNRIELGEIESAAMCVPGVEGACALFDGARQEIVLYLASRQSFVPRRFNLELKKYIPGYMMPARLSVMDALPLTPNGKIDRVALRQALEEGN